MYVCMYACMYVCIVLIIKPHIAPHSAVQFTNICGVVRCGYSILWAVLIGLGVVVGFEWFGEHS